MKYGKVTNGHLDVAPTKIKVNGRVILSPRAADYRAAGYLPIDTTSNPPEGYEWKDKWEIRDGKIAKKFDEIPTEEQEEIDGMRIVPMTKEEAEAYEHMEETIANAQAATQAAQDAAQAAQQEAAEAVAAKEAAEAAQAQAEAELADYKEVIDMIVEELL